ncbi:MAG: CvpA family protein [Eubacterium sp.]|nr:CvpA family protein [Eubacterium sp.]
MKKKFKVAAVLLVLLIGSIYYYIELPALNIHEPGFWGFVIVVSLLLFIVTILPALKLGGAKPINLERESLWGLRKFLSRFFFWLTIGLFVFYIGGSILSSEIVNARKYHDLIQIQDGNFNQDIEQISYNEIPLLDKDSAALVGNRKMGTMVEYVSQFEVSPDYTQINYKNKPVRVTPLQYGNWLKWFTNQSEGIPAYICIDMATQNAECVKLSEGMKYTESDHFNRNIHRYLRFRYPTYMFDTLNFELDENGTPVYICPVKDYTIGLFGGETISKVVIVNAVTGEHKEYDVKDVPRWVDRVYSSDLLVSYYDYYGTLKHGFWNSILSQKDCMKTTDGYNYIALDDDVWVYTGVTSAGQDQSNVGFVLMNQRTGQTKYYQISGATEHSAMSSAEGKVQNLKYEATFPLLMNIAGKPTYFICLKDSAGLVKQHAMVNIEKYTVVAIGSTVAACEKDYIQQLKDNGIVKEEEEKKETKTVSGKILRMTDAVVDGNSHFYLVLEGSDAIYDASITNVMDVVRYQIGDEITLEYEEGEKSNPVVKIGGE